MNWTRDLTTLYLPARRRAPRATANLPPCRGDVRQDRGRRRASRAVAIGEVAGKRLLKPFSDMVLFREIGEAGEFAVEGERDRASRPMALLGHDHLGLAAHLVHVVFPLDVFLGAELRLAVLEVIFLAIDEHDDVGVLLDRTGFAQV